MQPRKFFSLLWAFLALAIILACNGTTTPMNTLVPTLKPNPPSGSISGRVVSFLDISNPGKPISNAQVQVLDLPGTSATTNSNGSYVLPNIPNGEHYLYASSAYGTSNILTAVVNDNAQTLDIGYYQITIGGNIYLAPNDGRAVATDGKPVSGATVWVLRSAPFAISNSDGSFQLYYLDKGDIVVAATANRWGTLRYDPKTPLTITLNRPPPMPVPPRLIYDFVAHAADAQWLNGSHAPVWNLPDNDPRGFALWRKNFELEDGTRPALALETHPQWIKGGTISGSYPQVFTPQASDTWVIRYGFLKGALAGRVKFTASFVREADNTVVTIFNTDILYREGFLVPGASVPFPAETLGKHGAIQLRVDAGDSAAQDWAVWVEAKIIRTR